MLVILIVKVNIFVLKHKNVVTLNLNNLEKNIQMIIVYVLNLVQMILCGIHIVLKDIVGMDIIIVHIQVIVIILETDNINLLDQKNVPVQYLHHIHISVDHHFILLINIIEIQIHV